MSEQYTGKDVLLRLRDTMHCRSTNELRRDAGNEIEQLRAENSRLTRELDELRVKYDALQRGYFGLLRDSAPHQFASLQAGDPNYCAICGEARGHRRHDVYVGPLPAAPNEAGT